MGIKSPKDLTTTTRSSGSVDALRVGAVHALDDGHAVVQVDAGSLQGQLDEVVALVDLLLGLDSDAVSPDRVQLAANGGLVSDGVVLAQSVQGDDLQEVGRALGGVDGGEHAAVHGVLLLAVHAAGTGTDLVSGAHLHLLQLVEQGDDAGILVADLQSDVDEFVVGDLGQFLQAEDRVPDGSQGDAVLVLDHVRGVDATDAEEVVDLTVEFIEVFVVLTQLIGEGGLWMGYGLVAKNLARLV